MITDGFVTMSEEETKLEQGGAGLAWKTFMTIWKALWDCAGAIVSARRSR